MKVDKNAVFRTDMSAIEQLELWLTYQKHWCEHKPSVTISVKEDEWMEVGAWVYKNFDYMSGVSFLPFSEHTYQQAPYQDTDKEGYEFLLNKMPKEKKTLLDFWEEQMRQSHTASNYFFRKSPSHYHMMLLVMSAHKENKKLSVEELKTKLFKTSRPKSALIITEACEKGFFRLEKTSTDQRVKNIIPSDSFIKEFNEYLDTLKNISY